MATRSPPPEAHSNRERANSASQTFIDLPRLVSLQTVIAEIDMWRAACLMLWWYGEIAREEGVRRANELAAVGDDAGVAVWRRINEAIRQLANMTPPGKFIDLAFLQPEIYIAPRRATPISDAGTHDRAPTKDLSRSPRCNRSAREIPPAWRRVASDERPIIIP